MRTLVASCGLVLTLGLTGGCGGDNGDDSAGAGEPAALVDVPWVLSGGLEVEGWERAPPSATFAGETVGGSTGCNRFTGPYTVDGDSLEIGTIASTQIACEPPADAVERGYLDALARVARWRLAGADLVLLDDDDELLRFRVASPVGEWEATSIQTGTALTSPILGSTITATFADDGTLTGSAGCNTYSTSFTTDRGGIVILPPSATKKSCDSPAGVMEQEAAYLAALPTAVHYRLDGGSLALLAADGTYVASYIRAGSS
jgi:heat shock protein HslJ